MDTVCCVGAILASGTFSDAESFDCAEKIPTPMERHLSRFLIPEANDVASDAGTGFSGLVLYTLLSGCPVSIGKFSDGVLTGSASLWDDSRTREETVDEMVELLQGIYVARVRPRASTRAIIPPWRLWEKGRSWSMSKSC